MKKSKLMKKMAKKLNVPYIEFGTTTKDVGELKIPELRVSDDELQKENNTLHKQCDVLRNVVAELQDENDGLQQTVDSQEISYDELLADHTNLGVQFNQVVNERNRATERYQKLEARLNAIKAELDK